MLQLLILMRQGTEKKIMIKGRAMLLCTFVLGFVDVACLPNSAQYAFYDGLPMHSCDMSVLPPHA